MPRETRTEPREAKLEDPVVEGGVEHREVTRDAPVNGRAARVSGLVILLLAAAGGGIWWWANRAKEDAPAQVAENEAPRAVAHDDQVPAARFTDVTAQSGIDYVHTNGAEGEKLLPETMGGGSAFLDHDGDGDADILFVNACPWPHSTRTDRPTPALYANDGKGSFTNVTAGSGLDATFYGMGAACADVDADGDVDAYFTAVGPAHYFENDGGRFREVDAGVAGASDAWSTCACFLDAERDGDLDLYVGNYVRWSPDIDRKIDFTIPGIGRAYGPPTTFEGAQPSFYRNEGDGRFSEVAQALGLHVTNAATGVPVGKALGVRANDADADGDLDLMVANDTVANFFYRNDGGKFVECGQLLGLAFDREGRATGAMGIDAAWFRNDDAIAYATGNFAGETSSFYVSQGRPDRWADEAFGLGIGAPTLKYLKFGTLFLDYDLDGRQDYLQANGHLEDEIGKVHASQTYEQPAQLFWNAGTGVKRTYVEVKGAKLGDLARPMVGRGCSSADVDGDGDLDVLLTQSFGKPRLLRNDQALGNHWLRLHLVGKGKNRDAIGARVEVEVAGVKQCQDLVPFKSYLSQVELPLTFGLGKATVAERVTIHWPDGKTQELTALAADRRHEIAQAQ